jgi:hypothetical protein
MKSEKWTINDLNELKMVPTVHSYLDELLHIIALHDHVFPTDQTELAEYVIRFARASNANYYAALYTLCKELGQTEFNNLKSVWQADENERMQRSMLSV